MSATQKAVHSDDLGKAVLKAMGLENRDGVATRIVIDIRANELVVIYYTEVGEVELLDIDWQTFLKSAKVHKVK